MIWLESITFSYPHREPVFAGFDWRVERGETWAVLGPSGCGKSTLLYLLAGLRLPTAGTVRIYGQPVSRVRPQTGLILQDYGLLPWATVRQNAALGLRIRRFYGPDGTHAPRGARPDLTQADFWLRRLKLDDLADKYPAQLSGGQRQRTAIARTLATQPDLLLMDEPFSSLDAPTRQDLQTLTQELCREQNLTLVLVTHNIEEAAALGRSILVLGQPPNHTPRQFANPQAGTPGFHDSPAYQQICQRLRAALEEGT
jgi:ABC-type nitrate/sulfonate/bicarbonate transport system ATPase subunit